MWVFLQGCQLQPARWAVDLLEGLDCGMTLSDTEATTKWRVRKLEVRDAWMTHVINDGRRTTVWLGFAKEGLVRGQITWVEAFKSVATRDEVDLCK